MKRIFGLVLAVAASATLSAAMPTVSDVAVSMAQGKVRVDFTLSDGPAVVTAAFLTNGVPLDAALYRDGMGGDAGKLVANGSHRIKWKAYETMPNLDLKGVNLTAELKMWRSWHTCALKSAGLRCSLSCSSFIVFLLNSRE